MNGDPTPLPENPPTRQLEVTISGVSFRRWHDGDLEIDIDPDGKYDGWRGRYLNEGHARELRDFLNKAIPMSNLPAEQRCFHWETSEHHRELFWPDLGCPYCEITRLRKELDDSRSQPALPASIQEALNSGDGTYRP